MPSLEDNLPQTGIEAMACGTPVVAFASGGVPEYVHHGETGLLARTGNTAELTAQIDWLVAHQTERQLMGENSRKFVIEHFDHHKQAAKYVRVYRELLSDKQKLTHQAA
jgi:glycosyltransferase involved in cell wall biosynthesis